LQNNTKTAPKKPLKPPVLNNVLQYPAQKNAALQEGLLFFAGSGIAPRLSCL